MFKNLRSIVISLLSSLAVVVAFAAGTSQPAHAAAGDLVLTYQVAANDRIRIYLGGTVDAITVDWGDSSTTGPTSTAGYVNHKYLTSGTKTVTISGTTLTQFGDSNITEQYWDGTWWSYGSTSQAAMRTVDQWGTLGLTSLTYAFKGATGLTSIPATLPSTVTNMSYAFSGMGNSSPSITNFSSLVTTNVQDFKGIFSGDTSWNMNVASWDTSSATDMSFMFNGANNFNSNISSWQTGSVTTMEGMFLDAWSFNQNLPASGATWDVSKVTSMKNMFKHTRYLDYYTSAFNGTLTNWNVGKVTDFSGMFSGANAFNQPLSTWNIGAGLTISDTIDMSSMFDGARSFNQNILGWDVSKVTTMKAMFKDARVFNYRVNDWDTSAVTNMSYMFSDARAFNTNLTSFTGKWTTANVTDMSYMFYHSQPYYWYPPYPVFNGTLSNWDVSKVTDFQYMFYGQSVFNSDITYWEIGKNVTPGTPINMKYMFALASTFNQDIDQVGTAWDTSKVTNMEGMFSQASAFNQNIENWNTGEVLNMSYMFNGASVFQQPIINWNVAKVTTMESMFSSATVFNQDLKDWNTISVENMENMFDNADAFDTLLPEVASSNKWTTANVKYMSYMFANTATYNKSVQSWNTANVLDMSYMFSSATVYNQPMNQTTGPWSTSTVENMTHMFDNADAFVQDISSWNTGEVLNMSYMFANTALFDSNIQAWNVSKVTNMEGMFQNSVLYNQTLQNWNTVSVTNMSRMFQGSFVFDQELVQQASHWNTANVLTMAYMFESAKAFNSPLQTWNTSAVTDMSYMFQLTELFDQDLTQETGHWKTSSVTSMYHMFDSAKEFNHNIESWDVSKVSSFQYMFAGTVKFNQALNDWVIGTNVPGYSDIYMSYMFYDAKVFNQPLYKWDVSKVLWMEGMFSSADAFDSELEHWSRSGGTWSYDSGTTEWTYSGDTWTLDSWDTSRVTNFSYMFANGVFNQPITWDTHAAWGGAGYYGFEGMFADNHEFNQPLVHSGNIWDINGPNSYYRMFSGATKFNMDLSSLDFSNYYAPSIYWGSGPFDGTALSSAHYTDFLKQLFASAIRSNVRIDSPAKYFCSVKDTHVLMAKNSNIAPNDGKDWQFNDAGPAVADCNNDKLEQEINFTPPAEMAYNRTITLSATAVKKSDHTTDTELTPTFKVISGPCSIDVDGVTLSATTSTTEGVCVVAANQAGDSTYYDAVQVLQTIHIVQKRNSTVTYDVNGPGTTGSAPTDTATYANAATVTTKVMGGLDRDGFTFGGWSTQEDGSAPVYDPTSGTNTFTIGEQDVTLYAKWIGTPYTLTLHPNNGTSTSSQTIHKYDSLTLPTDSVRAGYDFDAWYDASSSGNKLTSPWVIPTTGNKDIYAYWTAKSYTITYNTQTGGVVTATGGSASYNTDGTFTLPSDPSWTGYDFLGWFTDPTNGIELTGTPSAPSPGYGNLIVYAHWDAIEYDVVLDLGGTDGTQTINYNIGGEVILPTPTRGGYQFDGWYDDPTAGNVVTSPYQTTGTSTINFYARWTALEWDVTFDVQGGAPLQTPTTYVTDGTFDLPTVAPTKPGFTFLGWFRNSSGGSAISTPYAPSDFGDITVYAQWHSDKLPIVRTKVYAFDGQSSVLTPHLKRQIKVFIKSKGKGKQALTCVGQTRGRVVNPYVKHLAQRRAIAACKYAKSINHKLKTKTKVEPAAGMSYKNRSVRMILVAPPVG